MNTLKWHDLTKESCVAPNHAPVEDTPNSRTASHPVSARQLGRSSPRTKARNPPHPVAMANRPGWISGVYNSDSARHYGFIPNNCAVVPPRATAWSMAGSQVSVTAIFHCSVEVLGVITNADPRVCLSSVGVRLIRLRRISTDCRVQVSDCEESRIRALPRPTEGLDHLP